MLVLVPALLLLLSLLLSLLLLPLPPLPLSEEAQQGCSRARRTGSPSRRPAGCRRRAANGRLVRLLVEASPPRLAVAGGGSAAHWAAAPGRGAGSRRGAAIACQRAPQDVQRPLEGRLACWQSRVAIRRAGGHWRGCAAAQTMQESCEQLPAAAGRPGAGRRAEVVGWVGLGHARLPDQALQNNWMLQQCCGALYSPPQETEGSAWATQRT